MGIAFCGGRGGLEKPCFSGEKVEKNKSRITYNAI